MYSFASDLGKIIIQLFKESYLEQYSDIISPVELLLKILESEKNGSRVNGSDITSEMIDDDDLIRQILLSFIVEIQSHHSLFNYSLKRHGYYKLFLSGLTSGFKGFEPILTSKILAGCLVGNEQVKPDDTLIDAMMHRDLYLSTSTLKAKKKFIDKLTPSTVFKIISQFKIYLQQFSKIKIEKEFDDIQQLSAKSILKKVWGGFSNLGLSTLTDSIEIVIKQIKKTFSGFIKAEKEKEEETKTALNKPFTLLIPKRTESIAFLKKNYSIVETDIIGFRGKYEGGSQKDFAYNARLFKKGEITLLEFSYCFKRLFDFLRRNKKVKIITFKGQKNIEEYFAAFVFSQYLICFGLTHVKTGSNDLIQEKDLFPYIILFSEVQEKKRGRIPGREVTHRGKHKIYDELVFIQDNAIIYYKSILYILHLLPDEDWNSSASQSCIKFLVRELRNLTDRLK